MSIRQYEYATMPVAELIWLVAAVPQPDAYLSEDRSSVAYCELLQKGFRWVRSEGDQAIFERLKFVYPKGKD